MEKCTRLLKFTYEIIHNQLNDLMRSGRVMPGISE